jgi:type VI secretion system secreted protein VgrG
MKITDLAYADFSLDGTRMTVLRFEGTEAVSTLFRYRVEVALELPLPAMRDVIGRPAELTIRDALGHERIVGGVIAEAELLAFDDQHGRATLELRPEVFRQTLGRDCLAMQEVSIPDILKAVLADYPGEVRYELVRSYPTFPYRVQYREDDWTYVSRVAEEGGLYYWFDHDGASSALVFADDSRRAPDLQGGAFVPFLVGRGTKDAGEVVRELSSSSRASSGAFAARSFDPDRPQLAVAASSGRGPREWYDASGGGYVEPDILARSVADLAEADAAARTGVSGLSTSIRLAPGRIVEVQGHPIARFDGRFLVTAIAVHANAGEPPVTRFDGIPADQSFRAPRRTPVARQAGLQMGVIAGPEGSEVHPDPRGRVRAQLHWDRKGQRDEKSGTWMRVAQRCTPGSMLLPRMGWNVATFNEEGAVDAPSIVSRIHDGEHLPPYSLPGNMTRVVYKTATTPAVGTFNEIYFEDKKGSEEMFVNASKDMFVRAKNRKVEQISNDAWRDVGKTYDLHVDGTYFDSVLDDRTEKVGANRKLEVQGMSSKSVEGNETEVVAGSRTIKCGENQDMQVKGNRSLRVGPAMLDLTLGEVGATAKDSLVLVGGAILRASMKTIAADESKVGIQAIGAAKIEIAKVARPTDATRTLTELVGGSMISNTNGKFIDDAKKTNSWRIGATFAADAPEVLIEAEESIKIKCGESVLTITADGITLDAPKLDLSGAHIDADTALIKHN